MSRLQALPLAVAALLLGPMGAVGANAQACVERPNAPCPFPRAQSVEEAFLHLQSALSGLNERAVSEREIDGVAAADLQENVNELETLFASSADDPISEHYLRSLDSLANRIRRAAAIQDPAAANLLIHMAKDDFEDKLGSARAIFGVRHERPKDIPLRVWVRRNNQLLDGYVIKLGDGDTPDEEPTISFTNATHPWTEETLTPGVYFLHVYKNGQRVHVQSIRFGLHGESDGKVYIDL